MDVYYFKQIDRATGNTLGYITYNGYYPANNDAEIELVEITEQEYLDAIRAIFAEEE